MALNFFDKYPTETRPPNTEYPFGSFRNASSSTSVDGTKLEEQWSNDFFALHWALLKHADIVPSGEVDTVENSQYFDALLKVIRSEIPDLNISNEIDGNRMDWVASEKAVGDLNRATVKKAGDTMTGNLTIQNARLRSRATSVPANNRGAVVDFTNNAGTGTFTTSAENGSNAITQRLPNQSGTLALGGIISGQENGYWRDPSTGLIIQWGLFTAGNYVGFNIPFNNVFAITLGINSPATNSDNVFITYKDNFGFRSIGKTPIGNTISLSTNYIAIGI